MRTVRILSLLAILALGLAACAEDGDVADDLTEDLADEEGDEVDDDVADDDAPDDDADPGDAIEIEMWHQEEPPHRVDQFQVVIDAFNESQDRFHVSQEVQTWDDAYGVTTSAIQADAQPDFQLTIPDFTVAVRETGAVQPVDDIIEELSADNTFLEAALEPYRDEGQVWAVPTFGMIQMLWYRADMFEDAGLDPDDPPQTWDELYEAAETLTGDGQYGMGLPTSRHLFTDQALYSIMVAGGAKDIFTEDGEPNFNTPETVESLRFYNDLTQFNPDGASGWSWAEPQAALNTGTLAMTIEKGQFLAPFEEESGQPPEDLGVAPVPWPEDGERGSIYYSNAAHVLTDDPERQEGVAEFLAFKLDPDNYAEWLLAEPGLFLPVTEEGDSETWRSDEVLSVYEEHLDLMMEQSEYGALFGFIDGLQSPAIGPISAQNILSQVVQQMSVEGMSPEEAAEWGQERMEEEAS